MNLNRVAVVGTSGSGKTTLARALAGRLGVPHVELDAFHWASGWTEVDEQTFRDRVATALETTGWVTDGNYSAVRDLYLARADTVVWLDLPLRTCLWRVIRRTHRRSTTGEELWGTDNRETWRRHVGRESLIWWVLESHRRRRREYEARFADPANAHLRVIRLRSSSEVRAWLASVPRR